MECMSVNEWSEIIESKHLFLQGGGVYWQDPLQ